MTPRAQRFVEEYLVDRSALVELRPLPRAGAPARLPS